MELIKKIVTVGVIVLLSACAEIKTAEQPTPTKENRESIAATNATAAIAAAEKARRAANKVGYEWRDTAELIKQARQAAKKRAFAKAIRLANKAKRQGNDAIAQYHDQKNAGSTN